MKIKYLNKLKDEELLPPVESVQGYDVTMKTGDTAVLDAEGNPIKGEPKFTFENSEAWAKSHYDPRCRPWYEYQYKKNHTTLSDIYRFTGGQLGLTICAPLWNE